MPRPPQPCPVPGCPERVPGGGRCARHLSEVRRESDAKRPSARERGYDTAWENTRGAYLAANPWCQEPGCEAQATDVDHRDGLGPSGPRGHDWSNLRGYCHSHHSKRTARDQPGGFNQPGRRRRHQPFVILAGLSGTGKTTLRPLLAARLGAVSFSPDEFVDRWDGLYPRLDAAERAVVECVRIPRALRKRIDRRGATIVLLTAPVKDRRRNLKARGEKPKDITRLLAEDADWSLAYEDDLTPDIEVEAGDLIQVAEEIASRIAPPPTSAPRRAPSKQLVSIGVGLDG